MSRFKVTLRRVADDLREQNWTAVVLEFLIVVVGVFLGMQVTNWNAARIERAKTEQLLQRVGPALERDNRVFEQMIEYYRTTMAYGETASRGWQGDPAVSDRKFVIAAYQATQIVGITRRSQFANLFAGDELSQVPNGELRTRLTETLADDRDNFAAALQTPYRIGVRRIMPFTMQRTIIERCGDDVLQPDCEPDLPPEEVARTAARLRADPELAGDLRWHLAEVRRVVGTIEARLELDEALEKLLPAE